MHHVCLNCGHAFGGSISIDELGPHTSCPKCESSFDVDITGEKFCISIRALYDSCYNLKYGHIIPDFDDGEMVYYDLYNDDDDLACLDGEVCVVSCVCDDYIMFSNNYGERDVTFKLAPAEAQIAMFGG